MRNDSCYALCFLILTWIMSLNHCNATTEIILNGTTHIVFPGNQLDRFYNCLCNGTSTICTVRYSKDESTFSVTGTTQTRTTTNGVLIGQDDIAYNCYLNSNEVSASTNFTCSRAGPISGIIKLGDGVSIKALIPRKACGDDRFVTVLWTSTVNITVSNWSANIPIMNEEGSNGTTTMTQRMVTTAMPTSVSSSSNSMVTASTRITRISNNDIPTATKQNDIADTSTGRFTTTTTQDNGIQSVTEPVSTTSSPRITDIITTTSLTSLVENMNATPPVSTNKESGTNIYAVVGTISGVLLIVAVIIIIVLVLRRRRLKPEPTALEENIIVEQPRATEFNSPNPRMENSNYEDIDGCAHSSDIPTNIHLKMHKEFNHTAYFNAIGNYKTPNDFDTPDYANQLAPTNVSLNSNTMPVLNQDKKNSKTEAETENEYSTISDEAVIEDAISSGVSHGVYLNQKMKTQNADYVDMSMNHKAESNQYFNALKNNENA